MRDLLLLAELLGADGLPVGAGRHLDQRAECVVGLRGNSHGASVSDVLIGSVALHDDARGGSVNGAN